jgi:alcohol dehydrogenase (cytochrome c)
MLTNPAARAGLSGASCVLAVLLGDAPSALAEPSAEPTVSFTASQAAAGKDAYVRYCGSCHGLDLEGQDVAPSLTGERFDLQWTGKSADVLLRHLRRMPIAPVADPGSLSDGTYSDILAYLLQASGMRSSETSLPSDAVAIGRLVIPPAHGRLAMAGADASGVAGASIAAGSSRLLADLPAVTDEMLSGPAPDDWLIWRRTHDSTGWSPLQQIDRRNVASLERAWRAPLGAGENMASPLIHRGVMFLHTYPDTTLALDASSGQVLWRHRYEPETKSSKKMGLALHGDRVFVPTSDLHVLALNARTGELLWDHAIVPESPKSELYQLRGAPLVAGNKVLQGIMSFRMPKGSFIVAMDIDTGREAWRFNTIARPGEPGGETWNDIPLDARNGGSVWVTGSYDPHLNLVYYGPAPTYDTAPLLHRVDQEGVSNDALYTNATIALNPDTGELVWHYQHVANDQWDLDWAFERQIVDLPVKGRTRRAVVTVGKTAIVEAMDAATGEYLFSIDLGLQNVISFIDPETGRKTMSPEAEVSLTETHLICPTVVGARSWPPTSFNPRTKMLYLPLTEGCMGGGPEGFKGLFTTGVGITMRPHPDSSDGNMGRLQAVDLATRQLAWSHRQPTPLVSSTLDTAGGVVFVADLEPSLQAFDDTSGELLWKAKLDDSPGSSLVTYAAGGRQYVAVVVGQENNVTRDWSRIYRAIAKERGLTVEEAPQGGAAIWAFALPR